MKPAGNPDLEIISFRNAKDFEKWLAKNHKLTKGFWLRLFKKNSGEKSISYDEALDEAICYGWIDGQLKSFDEISWLRKFSPRGAKSIWSKRNTAHAERLAHLKKMKQPGLAEMEKAKADGRWEKAYDPPAEMKVPDDFLEALSKNKKAKTFFDSLDKANTYAIAWRLHTAKKIETRDKRKKQLLEMMAKGKKPHE
ncbi:MAG: YdeI/OmpD-associated family protein [Bacteroidetes bacterium]|nr:YdeI/OmpD-associated family protein [Bacteroidota bacterium]